jgi:AcrR family transcriptional regulator
VTQPTAAKPPRQPTVDDRIFAASLAILRARGPVAVSVESVAAASGVAKTTIYRRYENRDSMLTAAVASAAVAVQIPADLGAKDSLRWVLRHAADTVENVVGRGTVAAVLANEDAHLTQLLLGMIRTSTRPFREHLTALARQGEIRADLDVELALSMLLGVVVAELIRGRPTDEAWVDSVLALLWPSFAA